MEKSKRVGPMADKNEPSPANNGSRPVSGPVYLTQADMDTIKDRQAVTSMLPVNVPEAKMASAAPLPISLPMSVPDSLK